MGTITELGYLRLKQGDCLGDGLGGLSDAANHGETAQRWRGTGNAFCLWGLERKTRQTLRAHKIGLYCLNATGMKLTNYCHWLAAGSWLEANKMWTWCGNLPLEFQSSMQLKQKSKKVNASKEMNLVCIEYDKKTVNGRLRKCRNVVMLMQKACKRIMEWSTKTQVYQKKCLSRVKRYARHGVGAQKNSHSMVWTGPKVPLNKSISAT